jgi:hypothetical protein
MLGQATGVGQVRRGPVGEKKSEGAYASPLPSPGAIEPPPPLLPILLCRIPFHMTYIVLRYGQPTQPQQLARASQTRGAECAALVLGEAGFDGPMGR